jgi:hypothetical protein
MFWHFMTLVAVLKSFRQTETDLPPADFISETTGLHFQFFENHSVNTSKSGHFSLTAATELARQLLICFDY